MKIPPQKITYILKIWCLQNALFYEFIEAPILNWFTFWVQFLNSEKLNQQIRANLGLNEQLRPQNLKRGFK